MLPYPQVNAYYVSGRHLAKKRQKKRSSSALVGFSSPSVHEGSPKETTVLFLVKKVPYIPPSLYLSEPFKVTRFPVRVGGNVCV